MSVLHWLLNDWWGGYLLAWFSALMMLGFRR